MDSGPGSDGGPDVDSGGGMSCGAGTCTADQVCCVNCSGASACYAGPSCPGFACPDAGPPPDAGPMCGGGVSGTCDTAGLSCQCCDAGGPARNCLCSTPCLGNTDCTDSARPFCNTPGPGMMGFCTAMSFSCCWGCD
jgi:hypothetical protein